MCRLLSLIAFCGLAVVASRAEAQGVGRAPKRPHSKQVADTNDAQSYIDYGVSVFEDDPDAAADAFYWAARINPGSADALYARRAALLMRDQRLLWSYVEGGPKGRSSSELRKLDSLQFRALMLNPFLYRRLDRTMIKSYIRQAMQRGGSNDLSRNEIDYLIDNYLGSAGPEMRGWLAYGEGDFSTALDDYAVALARRKDKAGLRMERARIFAMRGRADSAISEFQLALDEMRRRDKKDLVVLYDSKALIEHSIGILLEQGDDPAAAREAYGRALQEDLSYYPAHIRLGLLAITAHDTAVALSELDLAVQLAGNDAYTRYLYGYALTAFGKTDEAIDQLKKAVELEPYYALPYVVLGQLYEQKRDATAAATAFASFLARASQRDMQRSFASQHLADLQEYLAAVKK